MPELNWIRHHCGGQTAPLTEGHYLIQGDHLIRHGRMEKQRYKASLIRPRTPAVSFGYYPTIALAEKACQEHYDRRSRWDEDIEAGAIG